MASPMKHHSNYLCEQAFKKASLKTTLILDRFWKVSGRFWEGVGEVFSMFFCDYIEKRDFVKISVSPHRGHENQGFELSAYNKKSMKNR